MELSPLGFLVCLGVPLLFGAAVLRRLGIGLRTDPLAWFGWAWLVGSVGVGALEALRLALGAGSPTAWIAGSTLAYLGLLWSARRVAVLAPEGSPTEGARAGRVERWLFTAVLALVFAALVHEILATSLVVIHANDEANFWSLRAKLLYADGGFGPSYARAIDSGALVNASYPLLNSLLQVWVFDCAGAITHVANRFPFQLSVLALVLCAASAFRRVSRPGLAALFVLLLASTAPVGTAIRQANSDGLVALGGLVAADALGRAIKASSRAWIGLGALACTFLLWSKKEGALLLFVSALALVPLAWRGRTAARAWLGKLALAPGVLLWLAPPAAVVLGTQLHNLAFGAHGSHELGPGILTELRAGSWQLPSVLAYLGALGLRPSMNYIPAGFALLALAFWPRQRSWLGFVPLTCLFFVLALIAATVRGDADYLLRTASQRVVFQILPLQLLWIASITPELLGSLRPRKKSLAPARTPRPLVRMPWRRAG